MGMATLRKARLLGSHEQKRPDKPLKKPNSGKKVTCKMNTKRNLLNTKTHLKKAIYTYFIHKKNKAHSIKKLLETFGLAEE